MVGWVLKLGGLALAGGSFLGVAFLISLESSMLAAAPAILGAALLMMTFPVAIAALSIIHSALPTAFAPDGFGGHTLVLCALLAGVSSFLAVRGGRPGFGAPRLTPAHGALIGTLVVGIGQTIRSQGVDPIVVIAVFACLPMWYVGATYRRPDLPSSVVAVAAALPVLLALGIPLELNPIMVGNVSWMAVLLLLQSSWTIVVRVPALLVALLSWASTEQLGPRLAGAIALVVLAYQALRFRDLGVGRRWRQRAKWFAGGGLVAALIVGAAAAEGFVNEATSTGNNTRARALILGDVVSNVSVFGRGITVFEGSTGSKSFATVPHNFVADAIAAAGIVGIIGMIIVVARCARAILRSPHPLVPLCTGILMMNLFSGGLFRSPALWFALAFLVTISYERDATGAQSADDSSSRIVRPSANASIDP